LSESTGTERIIIVLLVVSLLFSGYAVMSISPIAKNTKDLADSIDSLSAEISEGFAKLGEEIEPEPEPAEEVVLNYPRGGIIITFDPHESYSVPTQECIVPVYETLLRYNPDFR